MQKSEIYGLIGSITFGVLLILLLLWLKFSFKNVLEENEGLTINFGDTMQGQGLYEPSPMSALETAPPMPEAAVPPPPAPVVPTPPAPPAEALQAQTIEESIEVIETRRREKEQREEEQRKLREERAAEQRRLAEERERQRIEQERIAEQRRIEEARIAEQKRIEAERAARAAAIRQQTQGALSGAGTQSGSGQGTSNTAGNQGNPFGGAGSGTGSGSGVGSGSGSGVGGTGSTARVGTRKISGILPEPSDNTQVEGQVVVDITVDQSGKVIEAAIGQGTNITHPTVRNAALNAARQAKFTSGDRVEIGKITYHFRLN